MAFLNWWKADLTGGRFVILWDDTGMRAMAPTVSREVVKSAIQSIREDLDWMGFVPFAEFLSSDNEPTQRAACESLGYPYPHARGNFAWGATSPVMGGQWFRTPCQTFHASANYMPGLQTVYVADDKAMGVTGYFTGLEFLPDCTHYEDIWRRLGYGPSPAREFVPQVARGVNNRKESKSDGACTLGQLREAGYKPWQIISTLRECESRSTRDGLTQVVIPYGYLTPERVKWLEFRGDIEAAKECVRVTEVEGRDFPDETREALAWTKRTNRRRMETLLDREGV